MRLHVLGLLGAAVVLACAFVFSPKALAADKQAAGTVGEYRSEHFYIHTDLSADKARELLDRLETMIALIASYWGRPPSGVIECYVVENLAQWPADAIDPTARKMIEQGVGITLSNTIRSGNRFVSRAIVYAPADQGTPQHEAVHAYCAQTFGHAGPRWYAEGMAEMGQYWQKDDSSVNCSTQVVSFLQSQAPKPVRDIVNRSELLGDTWQDYAWRWALCHLLANNTNYSKQFRPLGLALLAGERSTFEAVYGPMMKELDFEYQQLLANLCRGYRADLCSWDWKRKFRPLKGRTRVTAKVLADHGWQATGAELAEGESYEFDTDGTWQIEAKGDALSADGTPDGRGRLTGVLFKNFQLGQPFPLGAEGKFEAPGDGRLFVRAADDWSSLADNKGAVTLRLSLAGADEPAPAPAKRAPSPAPAKK